MPYPSVLDNLSTAHTDGEAMATIHANTHNALASSINAIETELGLLPKGNFADVKTRLSKPELLPPFIKQGILSVVVGTIRLRVPYACVIQDIRTQVGTAPTGASLIVDVNKNGTTVFTTQANRPTIAAAGTQSGVQTPDVTALAAGDYITVDIDQIGSTIAGSDLVVEILIAGR